MTSNVAIYRSGVILNYNTILLRTINVTRQSTVSAISKSSQPTHCIAVAGLALMLLAGCGGAPADSNTAAEPAAPLAVISVPAEIMTIEATYRTTAHLEADQEADVLVRVPGQVIDIAHEEGDRVAAGQVLATLDGDRLRLDMQRARTELDKAASELRRMTELKERNLVSAAAFDDMGFGVDELEANYELKRLEYEYSAVRAPIAGIVSSRNVKPGDQLDAGQQAFRITDTTRLVARLPIPQVELDKFKVGSAVSLTVDAAPNERFTATIARLSPTIDVATGTFRATLYIDNPENRLAPGMLGRFAIAFDRHSDALVVPTDALVKEDNATVVYVVDNGTALRKTVTTGIEAEGHTEIISGLSADDQVILSGQSRLREGSRVLAKRATSATPIIG